MSPVSVEIDSIPVGWFHVKHLLKKLFALTVISQANEITPYLFPGLKEDFGIDSDEQALLASAAQSGTLLGAVITALTIDMFGRRSLMLVALPIASVLFFLGPLAHNIELLCFLRFLQCAMLIIANMSISTWYVEFLPARGRGTLMAASTPGWPVGRAVVILFAGWFSPQWRPLFGLGGVGLLALFIVMLTAEESPRFLASKGNVAEANRILEEIRAQNGAGKDTSEEAERSYGPEEGAKRDAHLTSYDRVTILFGTSHVNLSFSIVIFTVLACTTVLLDTWGPRVWQLILSPGSSELPESALQVFNMGDLTGTILAIFISDRIGRKGAFTIGFWVQGLMYAALSTLVSYHHASLLITFGFLAGICRCFAWEAACFWTLEAFRTEVRGTAFCFCQVVMRLLSIVTLQVSGHIISDMPPKTFLAFTSAAFFLGGVVVVFGMPMETANMALAEGDTKSK